MYRYYRKLRGLRRRKFVCRRCRHASGVHVYCRILVDVNNIEWMYSYDRDLRSLHGGE